MAMGGSESVPGRGEVTSDTLVALCSARGEPALTTREIAEIANISEDCAREQLQRLESDDEIQQQTIGWGEDVWYPSNV